MPATRPYHHGDLRNACVHCALELLEHEGLDALTLRAVSQRAGVSRTAPYRHFATKRDLLAATSAAGFRLLARRLRSAMRDLSDQPVESLLAAADAYTSFALSHPCLYRLMFASDMGKGPLFDREPVDDFSDREFPELAEAGSASYLVLVDGLQAAQATGTLRRQNPREQALTLWSTLHGLISLYLDNRTGYAKHDAQALQAVSRQMMATVLHGILARKDQPPGA